jgi:hypothetical protein
MSASNVLNVFKQMEEMATALQQERGNAERAQEAARQYFREKEALQGRLKTLESIHGESPRAALASSSTTNGESLVPRARDEEEEASIPAVGLRDKWETMLNTVASCSESYKVMAVPSMDISTCVPESFSAMTDPGTSSVDEGNETCEIYALDEEGSSFVGGDGGIYAMYERLDTCSHVHPERAKISMTPCTPRRRTLHETMCAESLSALPVFKPKKVLGYESAVVRGDEKDLFHLLSNQLF